MGIITIAIAAIVPLERCAAYPPVQLLQDNIYGATSSENRIIRRVANKTKIVIMTKITAAMNQTNE
jgi:hypothetical protein